MSEVSRTLNAGGMGRQDWETETLIPTNGGGFDVANTLQSAHSHAVAVNIYGGNKRPDRPEGGFYVKEEATSKTLDSASGLNPSAAQGGTAVIAPSLTAFNMDSRSPQSEEQQRIVGAVYKTSMQVRRLTPRECERLQGFPDDYTLVQHRNKPAADGPRYKALGNSMAVPVMAWIGRRIAMVEQLKGESNET